MANKMIRIPRPTGTTELALMASIDPTPQNKERLQKHLIQNWINNSFTINKRAMNITQFSSYTNISTTIIIREISRTTKALGDFLNPNSLQETLRALTSQTISWTWEDRSLVTEQLHKLLASQGDKYVPFVSGEVNKTLDLMMKSNKNLMDVIKLMQGPTGTTVNILNQAGQGTENQKDLLTTEDAILLIQANDIKALEAPENNHKALEAQYKIAQLPEIDARQQKVGRGNKEGLNIGNIADLQKVTHEDRREEEYDIDPKADQM